MDGDAIITAIREVATGALGAVRTVPAGTIREGVYAGLNDSATGVRARVKTSVDVRAPRVARTGAVGHQNANIEVVAFEVDVLLTHATAHEIREDQRHVVRAQAAEDATTIRRALGYSGQLVKTSADVATGIVSGLLLERAPWQITREDWGKRILQSELRLRGLVQDSVATPAAPVFTSSPAIYVAGAVDPEVGATLIADPGVVTGAHTERGQWMRDGVAIDGETGVTYELVEADEGASITYRATAIGSGGTTTSDSNAITAGEAIPPAGFPSLSRLRHLWVGDTGVDELDGVVQAWLDTWGGYSASPDFTTGRPTPVEASALMNGHPTLAFVASEGDRLAIGGRAAFDWITNPDAEQGVTLFAAWCKTGTAAAVVLDSNNTTTNQYGLTVFHDTSANGRVIVRVTKSGAAVINLTTSIGSVPSGAPHYLVLRIRENGTPQWDVRVDGAEVGSGSFASAPESGTTFGPLTMGGRTTPTASQLDGEIGAVGMVDARIDDTELGELETWLERYIP